MIDRLQRFVKAGIARVRIDARTMDAAETERLTRAYRSAFDGRVYDMRNGLYTHGHYNRGVTK
jgi:putative protease